MKGLHVKKILREKGISIAHCARMLGISQQNLSAALSKDDIRTGLLESIAEAIGTNMPYFYGVDSSGISASTSGDSSMTVAGNQNNVNSDNFVQLLAKKDEQIDRLLTIIETLKGIEKR